MVRTEALEGRVQQYPFHGWVVDFAWPELKVAVEIDGWAHHRDHKAFSRDMRKRNALATAGGVTLSFSRHDLTGDPAGCLEPVIGPLRDRMFLAG
ncbi:endonuclease domain-containing protein [Gordonia sp. FQ]|uniref:endonuclease domain-containing protein n=1 Tax=Gordonia sp. FQ TaxID=3446634 RepID=UPI003F877672